jgi:hypothetical protein
VLHQGNRSAVSIRRDGRTLYYSTPGEEWQSTSLRSAIQGESIGQLVLLPTDVLALVALVPSDGFVERETVDEDGERLTHATFSVDEPEAYPTNLIDGDRLLDILDDLKGPLTGEVWFDSQKRLRKTIVRATGKRFNRDFEYTVKLSDFGKEFTLAVPIVPETSNET